jgi:hypothetical protein
VVAERNELAFRVLDDEAVGEDDGVVLGDDDRRVTIGPSWNGQLATVGG